MIFVGWLAAAVPAAVAQQIGDNVSGYVAIDGKQVPLPRGEWLVAGFRGIRPTRFIQGENHVGQLPTHAHRSSSNG